MKAMPTSVADPLTTREKVLVLRRRGMTARQIAAELQISTQAVYKHLKKGQKR